MKKIALFFALLWCINTNAQIQRTLYGQTLGVSTLDDLRKVANERGLSIERLSDVVFEIKSVTFGGYSWDRASFRYNKKKLVMVSFSKEVSNRNKIEKEILFDIYINLDRSLSNKYSNYLVKRSNDYINAVWFKDGTTSVELKHADFDISTTLLLRYDDLQSEKMEKGGDDEL